MQKTKPRMGPQFGGLMEGIRNDPPELAAEATRKPGRPVVHHEAWVKPQFVMKENQQDFLDDMGVRLERASNPRTKFDRSKIVRAMVEGWRASGLTMDGVESEDALADLFKRAFALAKEVRV